MKELTREEIDKKLKGIREKTTNKTSGGFSRPKTAMCYSMPSPKWGIKEYKVKIKCSGCKCKDGTENIKTIMVDESTLEDLFYFNDEETFLGLEHILDEQEKAHPFLKPMYYRLQKRISNINSIVHEYRNMGLDVKLEYYCEDCSYTNKPRLDMYIKAKNEEKWNLTNPGVFPGGFGIVTNKYKYEMLLRFLKRRSEEYLSYLEKNIKISYDEFCKNFYQLYKEGKVLKEDFYMILDYIYIDTPRDIKEKCKTLASFEKIFAEKTEDFIGYINQCSDSRNIYEKYIKKLAVELNLKTQEQFINDSFAAANYKIPFGDLLNIIDCKDKFFDSEIDSDGDDGKC